MLRTSDLKLKKDKELSKEIHKLSIPLCIVAYFERYMQFTEPIEVHQNKQFKCSTDHNKKNIHAQIIFSTVNYNIFTYILKIFFNYDINNTKY